MEYKVGSVPTINPSDIHQSDTNYDFFQGNSMENSSLAYTVSNSSYGEMNYTTGASNLSDDFACVMRNDLPDVVTSHKVYAFVSLTLVIIGLVGNSLSMLVFSSREMRTLSSNVYLLFLAVSDSAYLVLVFLTKLLTTFRCFYFTDVPADIFHRNLYLCKALQYLLDLFSNYSACLILAFTVERYFAVYKPLAFKERFSVRRAQLMSAVLLGLIGGVTVPHHMLYIGRPYNFNICTVLPKYETQFTVAYTLEMFIFRIAPVVIIAVLNVFIIISVRRVAERHKRRLVVSAASHSGANRRDERNIQMTVMLIVVSTTYIILFVPALFHFVMWKLKRTQIETQSESTVLIWQNYTRPLYIAAFAINFFLYTVSGRVFREQLIKMMRGGKQRRHNRGNLSRTHCSTEQCIALVQSNGATVPTVTDL